MKIRAGFLSSFFIVMLSSAVSQAAPLARGQVHDRLARSIVGTSNVVIAGNVHPLANARNDRGQMSSSARLEHVMMMFKVTDAQQVELNTLLEQQQDPKSSNYHQWLTPEQFADRFGLSTNDMDKVAAWLQNQGFTVDEIARSRRSITFSGLVGQIESAFKTSIHRYNVHGQIFYANATDPSIPAALSGVVLGFHSLNNFRLTSRTKVHLDTTEPQFTSNVTGNHYIAPSDFTTIYDLSGLYAAGLDGSGQSIAVVGQTDIQLSDIQAFRKTAGLPANDPQVILVPGMSDPGISNGDITEANLDLEWSGAVAPNAHIVYVNSNNALVSLQYAVEQNLASIISVSYGDCESNFPTQDLQLLEAVGQQANVQGITILSASGDNGAADCESTTATIATHGVAVDMPAAMPYVTGLGGSEFKETTASSWTSTNTATNGSALAYIPEVAWNDTNSRGIAATGGGRSIYFPKPSWQQGAGVPNDSARDVPDISLSASADHDGYLICSQGSCVNGYRSSSGSLTVVGGTSVAAPSFAGIVALLNQKLGTRQGNINSILYNLAATAPTAFHDITGGGNQVPCQAGSTGCPSTGTIGYSAGPGYDQATGLGSVDVGTLITVWPTSNSTTSTPSSSGTTPNGGSSGTTSSGSGSGTGTSSGSGGGTTSTNGNTVPAPLPIPVVEQGSIRTGYMIITPDPNTAAPTPTVTYGIVASGMVQSQAGVTPTSMMTDGSLYAYVIPGIGRNLGVALANSAAVGSTVTLTLRDINGNQVGNSVTVSLAPQQQVAKFVNELFSPTVVGSYFLGSLRVQSTSPVGVMGLRFSGTEFSTLPVAVNAGNAAGSLILPQFAMGGGWATQLALVNNNAATISGRISIFDTAGNPMVVTMNGLTQSSFSYSVPAGGTFVLAPRDSNGQSPF